MRPPTDRFILIDDELYQKCTTCEEYKPLDKKYFYESNRYTSGLMSKCIVCNLETDKESRNWRVGFRDDMKKWEREALEEVLGEVMGFELYNPENPVSKQFYERVEKKYGIKFY